MLVNLKSLKNTVPVPGHWSQKRKYLQGKRGIEKPPFVLPSYIRDTGVTEQRDATHQKDEDKSLRVKTKEKLQPKMGKLNLDYEKLHAAFFKFQTKPPRMTTFGDLYYEGREYETKIFHKKPGVISQELRDALGLTSRLAPPPWLINMQRIGPPPSYPWLKIPGLNAPIPEGAAWGYHPGGWGKAPVDEFNRPLYGDVFGTTNGSLSSADMTRKLLDSIDRSHWGDTLVEDIDSIQSIAPYQEEEDEDAESSPEDDE